MKIIYAYESLTLEQAYLMAKDEGKSVECDASYGVAIVQDEEHAV